MIVKLASLLGLMLLVACMFPMNAFAQPTITVTPTSILTGQTVVIVGTSFPAYDHVGVYADPTAVYPNAFGPIPLQITSLTAYNGFFHTQLTFQLPGTYSVYAVDYDTGVVTPSVTVTVSPA